MHVKWHVCKSGRMPHIHMKYILSASHTDWLFDLYHLKNMRHKNVIFSETDKMKDSGMNKSVNY